MSSANVVVLFIVVQALVLVLGQECGFHWETYNGTTPSDAVEGGKDANGNIFYIGQAYIKLVGELAPGMIIPSIQAVKVVSFYVEQNLQNGPSADVKILCSNYKEGFKWIQAESKDMYLLESRNLVVGGNFLGRTLYIGRVRLNGGMVLGKVFHHSALVFKGLYVPSSGTHEQHLSYELLAFDCNKNKANISTKKEESKNYDKVWEDIFQGL